MSNQYECAKAGKDYLWLGKTRHPVSGRKRLQPTIRLEGASESSYQAIEDLLGLGAKKQPAKVRHRDLRADAKERTIRHLVRPQFSVVVDKQPQWQPDDKCPLDRPPIEHRTHGENEVEQGDTRGVD